MVARRSEFLLWLIYQAVAARLFPSAKDLSSRAMHTLWQHSSTLCTRLRFFRLVRRCHLLAERAVIIVPHLRLQFFSYFLRSMLFSLKNWISFLSTAFTNSEKFLPYRMFPLTGREEMSRQFIISFIICYLKLNDRSINVSIYRVNKNYHKFSRKRWKKRNAFRRKGRYSFFEVSSHQG